MGKIQVGEAQSYGRPGDRVWIRVGDKDVPARAASEINSSQVLVTTDEDGQARAFTSTSPELLRSETTTFVKQEPLEQPKTPVAALLKILFSIVKDNEEIFYIGGDREEPVQVCAIPYRPEDGLGVGGRGYGTLQATGSGLDNFLVSVYYSAPNATATNWKRAIITRSPDPNLKTQNWQIADLPTHLEYLGNGVWSISAFRAMDGGLLSASQGESAFREAWTRLNFKPEPSYAVSANSSRTSIPSAIVYGHVPEGGEDPEGVIEWFTAFRANNGNTHSYTYPHKLTPTLVKTSQNTNTGLFPQTNSWQTLLITPKEEQVFYYQERHNNQLTRVQSGVEASYPIPATGGSIFGAGIAVGANSRAADFTAVGDALYFPNYPSKGLQALTVWSKDFYALIQDKKNEKKWRGVSLYTLKESGETTLVKDILPEVLPIPLAEEGDRNDPSFVIHAIAYLPSSSD